MVYESQTTRPIRSSNNVVTMGLSGIVSMHLRAIASKPSIPLGEPCVSEDINKESKQSMPRPSEANCLHQSVRSAAPEFSHTISPALFPVKISINITPNAYISALREGFGFFAAANYGSR